VDEALNPLRALSSALTSFSRPVSEVIGAVPALSRIGLLRPYRPDQVVAMLAALRRWGLTPATGYAAMAARDPHGAAVIDEAGTLTFADVHRRTASIAAGLADAGVAEGDNVGVLCRNHRGFVEATVALSKVGADAFFLNTSFAGPQLSQVIRSEKLTGLIYDEEFAEEVRQSGRRCTRFVAWVDEPDRRGRRRDPTFESLVDLDDVGAAPPPARPGRQVILTSGTTGRPKGARRGVPLSLNPLVAFLDRVPLRHRDTTLIAAPLFHAWGLGNYALSLVAGATVVLQRRFDAESVLAAVEEHRVTVLAAVPVMIQRIMMLPESVRDRYDMSSLRVVGLSGSPLRDSLAHAFMDTFGDIVYSLYGSTEVGWAAIATPRDLREAPGTAGFPPRGTVVRIVDDEGEEVPPGTTGRIFVGSELLFEGYTAGEGKEMLDKLMSTGDLGHLDEDGRLFVEGREDDMIVSGGENVFPQEVEALLRDHEDVLDAAVIGVPDEQFGHRLKALVVPRGGAGVSPDDLRAYVRANLSRFKVPRDVELVDELPRNPTGKILRRQLEDNSGSA
jgi:fatty-acyl-CoA synthase